MVVPVKVLRMGQIELFNYQLRIIITCYLRSYSSAHISIWIWFGFPIVGYLMPNPLYTYILNIYDSVWLGFMAYQPLSII